MEDMKTIDVKEEDAPIITLEEAVSVQMNNLKEDSHFFEDKNYVDVSNQNHRIHDFVKDVISVLERMNARSVEDKAEFNMAIEKLRVEVFPLSNGSSAGNGGQGSAKKDKKGK